MPVGKRGLVAPQNTFLENVIRRCNNAGELTKIGTSLVPQKWRILKFQILHSFLQTPKLLTIQSSIAMTGSRSSSGILELRLCRNHARKLIYLGLKMGELFQITAIYFLLFLFFNPFVFFVEKFGNFWNSEIFEYAKKIWCVLLCLSIILNHNKNVIRLNLHWSIHLYVENTFRLAFMHGEHGEVGSLQKMQEALENARTEQAEIGLCKKNSKRFWKMNICSIFLTETPIWLLVHLAPIKNHKDAVVLYLCQFKDITPLKQPLDDENNKGRVWF